MLKTIPLIIGILIHSLSFAEVEGHGPGNGGDIVLCKNEDGSIKSVETLDIYMSRTIKNYDFSHLEGLSKKEILQEALKPYDLHAPLISWRIRKLVEEFKNTVPLESMKLRELDDSNEIGYENGCSPVQAVIQRTPLEKDDLRYHISKEVLDLLSPINKIALALHEVFYGIAIENSETNSEWVQKWVAKLLFNGSIKNRIDFTERDIFFKAMPKVVRSGYMRMYLVNKRNKKNKDLFHFYEEAMKVQLKDDLHHDYIQHQLNMENADVCVSTSPQIKNYYFMSDSPLQGQWELVVSNNSTHTRARLPMRFTARNKEKGLFSFHSSRSPFKFENPFRSICTSDYLFSKTHLKEKQMKKNQKKYREASQGKKPAYCFFGLRIRHQKQTEIKQETRNRRGIFSPFAWNRIHNNAAVSASKRRERRFNRLSDSLYYRNKIPSMLAFGKMTQNGLHIIDPFDELNLNLIQIDCETDLILD
tara:strand:+ start:1016 stop:2440 length:1425 start_codon:yes stop_codon:yes gene_type:complete